jgi:hypothetical protein
VSPAREASAFRARFIAPRSAPEGPLCADATGPRIIRAEDVKYDDVKRETKGRSTHDVTLAWGHARQE